MPSIDTIGYNSSILPGKTRFGILAPAKTSAPLSVPNCFSVFGNDTLIPSSLSRPHIAKAVDFNAVTPSGIINVER